MNKLMAAGSLFLKKMDTNDLALLKVASCSAGVLMGLCAAKHARRPVRAMATLAFAAAFVPLAGKFIRTITEAED